MPGGAKDGGASTDGGGERWREAGVVPVNKQPFRRRLLARVRDLLLLLPPLWEVLVREVRIGGDAEFAVVGATPSLRVVAILQVH